MAKPLPAGPFETLDLGDGKTAPVYLIPFDKRGRCKAPKTRKHLIKAAKKGDFTHVFLFSHGWNNTFKRALKSYREFFELFGKIREASDPLPDYRPLLVGVIWPSISLLLPWERPPRMRALSPELDPADEVDETVDELDEIAADLPEESVERFYELAGGDELNDAEAMELAQILQPLYRAEDPDDESEPPSSEELVGMWREVGTALDAELPEGEQVRTRGLDKLDPRNVVRAFTVWKMKDRAGKVGAAGVGPLLADLIRAADGARAHLIGHSFGAKIVLSAAKALPAGSDGKVESALLLQPAINGWAFAADVAGRGFPGGYRKVLSVVRQPILSTFSRHDAPLTKFFHLAVRRKGDLGETRALTPAPKLYGALGGFGPVGTPDPEGKELVMPGNGQAYPDFGSETEVVGLKGDEFIDGHGGVRNEHTAWALFTQVRRTA